MKILLTGASGGIGQVIKITLETAGHEVVTPTHEEVDLINPKEVAVLAEKTGNIDWLVCSQGFIDQETTLEHMTPENIENTFKVNILSVIYLAQQFLPHLSKDGGIITLSSSAGVNANGRFAPYSASKAAVNSFMQALARNRPEQKFFAVAPGPTNTRMRNRVASDATNQQSPEVVANVVKELLSTTGKYKSGDVLLVKNGETSVVSKI